MRRVAKGAAAAALLGIMSVCAWALAQSAAKDDRAATMELMRSIVSRSAYDAMLEQMYGQMSATMQQAGGKTIPAAKQKALKDAVQDCMSYDDLLAWSTDVYVRHFSRKEIDDLAAFYKTPTGKKLSGLMPVLSGEVGGKLGPILMTRLPAALKKHGLE